MRLETPSAAAEFLTQKEFEVRDRLEGLKNRMTSSVYTQLVTNKERLSINRPSQFVDLLRQIAADFRQRLHGNDLMHRSTELLGVFQYQLRIDEAIDKLQRFAELNLQDSIQKLENLFKN